MLQLATNGSHWLWAAYYNPLNFMPYAFGAPLLVALWRGQKGRSG
jgi:hypothetical protein